MKKFLSKNLIIAALAVGTCYGTANAQIVINEIWNGSGADEFVEFHNPTGAPVDVSGWTFVRRTNAGTSDQIVFTFPAATTIAAGGYYTIADTGVSFTPDATYTNIISTGSQGVGLRDAGSVIIDGIGIATSAPGVGTNFFVETAITGVVAATGTGIKRDPNGVDTNDNSADFVGYSGFANATPGASNDAPPPPPTQVANLAEARLESVGETVEITGTVIVTAATGFNQASRNQFVVQDASGADGQTGLFIDDPTNVAGTAVNPGDTITGLTGTLSVFGGLLQLVPTQAIVVGGSVAVPAPLVLTNTVTVLNDVEAELVTIENATIAETGEWAVGTSYTLTAPTDLVVTVIRLGNDNPLGVAPAETIPAGAFDVTGIVLEATGPIGQVQPRTAADVVPASSSVSDWMLLH